MDLKVQEQAEQVFQDTTPEERYEESETVGFSAAMDTTSPTPATGAHVQIRDMADQRRRNRRLMGISFIWFVTLAGLAIAALMAFQNRQKIVENYPATASIYKALGVNVNVFGLEFEDPMVRQMMVNGENRLVINGHVANISNKTREIPMIELSLFNKAGEELARWIIEPPAAELEADKRIAYTSEYPNPPVDVDTIKYEFITDEELNEPVELKE